MHRCPPLFVFKGIETVPQCTRVISGTRDMEFNATTTFGKRMIWYRFDVEDTLSMYVALRLLWKES